ncbi:MAG: hypothetical protein AB1552_01970 [Nitrospirota bacterium]
MDAQISYAFLGLSEAQWEFINTFAPWLSAIGTIAAVITSLYLAMRDRIIKLKIAAFFKKSKFERDTHYIAIYITNIGHRTANVLSLYWKSRKTIYEQERTEFDQGSSDLPIKLSDGEEAKYFIAERRFKFNFDNFKSDFPKGTIIIGVKTSTGKLFESKVDTALQTAIAEYFKKREDNP